MILYLNIKNWFINLEMQIHMVSTFLFRDLLEDIWDIILKMLCLYVEL